MYLVDISRQIDHISPILHDLYDLYDLAHVGGWDRVELATPTCRTWFLGGICITFADPAQPPHNRQVGNYIDDL